MRDLRLEMDGGVATLLIDRPQARNALATQTMRELDQTLGSIQEGGARVLVIRGAGDRAFCAGGDLKELEHMRSEKAAAEMAHAMRATLDRAPFESRACGFRVFGAYLLAPEQLVKRGSCLGPHERRRYESLRAELFEAACSVACGDRNVCINDERLSAPDASDAVPQPRSAKASPYRTGASASGRGAFRRRPRALLRDPLLQ